MFSLPVRGTRGFTCSVVRCDMSGELLVFTLSWHVCMQQLTRQVLQFSAGSEVNVKVVLWNEWNYFLLCGVIFVWHLRQHEDNSLYVMLDHLVSCLTCYHILCFCYSFSIVLTNLIYACVAQLWLFDDKFGYCV